MQGQSCRTPYKVHIHQSIFLITLFLRGASKTYLSDAGNTISVVGMLLRGLIYMQISFSKISYVIILVSNSNTNYVSLRTWCC